MPLLVRYISLIPRKSVLSRSGHTGLLEVGVFLSAHSGLEGTEVSCACGEPHWFFEDLMVFYTNAPVVPSVGD